MAKANLMQIILTIFNYIGWMDYFRHLKM